MSARHKARKRALDILFESHIRGVDPLGVLADRQADSEVVVNPYTAELVAGVVEHTADIDGTIAQYARGWDLDRMPAADLCILRIATFELRHSGDVPAAVAISEAVELAQDLSTEESAAFVNGVLGSIAVTASSQPPSSQPPSSQQPSSQPLPEQPVEQSPEQQSPASPETPQTGLP